MKRARHTTGISPQLEELLGGRAGLGRGLQQGGGLLAGLARAVKELSDAYVAPETCDWAALYKNEAAVRAYLLYYLPVNLVKLFPVLGELDRGGAFAVSRRRSLSVLDMGCGPGTFLLGVLEYLRRCDSPPRSVALTGLDRERDSLAAAESLLRQYCGAGVLPPGLSVAPAFSQSSLGSGAPLQNTRFYDIIIAGNVLAELPDDRMRAAVEAAAAQVAPGGCLVIIEPGTRRAARRLLAVRDMLLNRPGLRLYGPCLSAGACPLAADASQWCHEKLFWRPTGAVQRIDDELGFSKQKGIKYAYLSFVKTDAGLLSPWPGLPRESLWRVVSYVIRNKGEDRLWLCNGRERRLVRRLARNRSAANAGFGRAGRGDIVFVDKTVARRAFDELPRDGAFRILSAP